MSSSFGDFFKQARQNKNLTQKQIAEMVFVSESAVSKWEKGVSHPDITLLPKLAEILGVTEHELITASVDNQLRKEKIQAKKWRALVNVWDLFFYISYGITLITCFVCNLAVNGTLSWFWIVFSSLTLAFSFTNFPKFIKRYKLIIIPLIIYISLIFLLGVITIYTKEDWFFIASVSVLFGLVIVFTPIIIAKYTIFNKIKKYNDFISIGIDFAVLNILFLVIQSYTLKLGVNGWYLTIALPIATAVYFALNLLCLVKFLKTNKFIKTAILLFLINNLCFLPPMFVKVSDPLIQKEINEFNILKSNLALWNNELLISCNIALIIFLFIAVLDVIFAVVGVIKIIKTK